MKPFRPPITPVATATSVGARTLALAVEGSLLSEDLYEFAKAAWSQVEPGKEFRDNWHLKVICDHLMAVSRGEIQNLIINVPPRTMKSLLISVLWPGWEWTWRPTRQWLYSSYGQALATRDALKTRRLIQTRWYQERWGHVFTLTGDQNQKTRYDNDKLGYRLSTSVGGLGTGEGGDVIVVDDPHNVEEAESELVREGTVTWWRETMSTRGNDPEKVAKVIVMQRVHEADLTAECLKLGGYEHLCLPMEFERKHPTKSSTSLGFKDPRTKEGELLWATRFTTTALTKLKTALGEYGTAGQLQQRPTPRGGGLFKSKHIKLWPHDKDIPAFEYILQSYDTAFTEKTVNDPTAHITLGIFMRANGTRAVFLLEAWDEYLHYPALRKKVLMDWKTRYGYNDRTAYPGRRADALLMENKGSGISLIQELRSANVPVQEYNPGKADKVARAERVLPLYEMGLLYVLESEDAPRGQYVDWARPFVEQVTKFGPETAAHDDYVDTMTQALIYLKDAGLLAAPIFEEDEPATAVYGRKPRNPYD